MAGIRHVIAGGLMYAVLRARGVPAPTRAQWPTLFAMGVMLLALGNGLVCVAEQTVSSGMAAVAVASAPLWMALFEILRGDRPTRMEWVGMGLGFVGVGWLKPGSRLNASMTGLGARPVATRAIRQAPG